MEEQPSASEPVVPANSATSQIMPGIQSSEAMQAQLIGVSPVSTETLDTTNTSGVSSQVGWSSPIVSSAVQSRVSESPPAQVTQSREATQIRVSDSSGFGIVQPIQARVDSIQVPSSEAMQLPVQSAETSLVQTTSEVEEVSQPEEPSSEVEPAPEALTSMEVTESDSQESLPIAQVDSSESVLSKDLSQDATRATQAMAESSLVTSKVQDSVVHVGIVEPNRPEEVDLEVSQEEREAVDEVRQERDASEVQLLEEQVDVEVSGQSGEATLEQADTTQEEGEH